MRWFTFQVVRIGFRTMSLKKYPLLHFQPVFALRILAAEDALCNPYLPKLLGTFGSFKSFGPARFGVCVCVRVFFLVCVSRAFTGQRRESVAQGSTALQESVAKLELRWQGAWIWHIGSPLDTAQPPAEAGGDTRQPKKSGGFPLASRRSNPESPRERGTIKNTRVCLLVCPPSCGVLP